MPTASASTSSCPTESSLAKLAPEKDVRAIRRTMGRLRLKLDEAQGRKSAEGKPRRASRRPARARR